MLLQKMAKILLFPRNVLEKYPNRHNLDFPRLKEFADKNLKFEENGGSSPSVENTVGKEEIAHCVFQKNCTVDV